MKDQNTVLIVIEDEEKQLIAKEVLSEQKYRVVIAINSNEARLKYSNEKFHMVILDMDLKGFNSLDFVEGIRRKENLKNITDIIPVLIISASPELFTEKFSGMDNVKFLDSPFKKIEFKKKLLTFTGHSDVISSNTKAIPKGEFLITEGGTSHEMYWILSGRFQITKLNIDNQNVILGDVFPGELVGEMSFLDNLPRSASVRAIDDCEVLVIPHKKFIDVLENQPRWFRSLMQTMSQRLRSANSKIAHKVVSIDQKPEKEIENI